MIPDPGAQPSDMSKPKEAYFIQGLPRLHSRRKLHQQRPVQGIITAIRREINGFHSIQRHGVNQTRHISSRDTVHQNGALVSIRARDRVDRRLVLVARLSILKLDHRVAVAEEPCRRQAARIEDDRRDVRRHVGVRVGRGVLHVRADGGRAGGCGGVVDVVEEYACDGYVGVGFGVARPGGVDVDVGDYG